MRRLGKRVIRATVGAARLVWRAADPAQRYVVAPRPMSEPGAQLPSLAIVVDAGDWSEDGIVRRELAGQSAGPYEVAIWDRTSGSVEVRPADRSDPRRTTARTVGELVASVEADYLVELTAAARGLPSTLLECLQWLLASERLAYLRVFVAPVEDDGDEPGVLMPCARSLWRPGTVDLEGLAALAAERPVVGKTVGLAGRLDAAVPRLAPLGPDSRAVVCRTGRYDIWAGNRAGPVEHLLQPLPKEPSGTPEGRPSLLVVVAAPLTGAAAGLVAATVREVSAAVRVVVVSTAADDILGVRRALQLERLGATVYELGTSLQPEIVPSAVERIAARLQPASAIVVGSNPLLEPSLSRLRSDGVRIIGLPAGGFELAAGVDAQLVPDGGRVGEEADAEAGEGSVPASAAWLLTPERSEVTDERRRRIRDELGVSPGERIVLTVGDLVPAGRPEDVVVVADRLRDLSGVRFVVVGEGRLATVVIDLAGFLGVDSLLLRSPAHPLEELVAAAEVVLDPSDEPVARPAVAAALAAGVPVVTAPGGGAGALIAGIGGGVVAAAVGDAEGLADGIRAVLDGGERPEPARARDLLALRRDETAVAVRRAVLGLDRTITGV